MFNRYSKLQATNILNAHLDARYEAIYVVRLRKNTDNVDVAVNYLVNRGDDGLQDAVTHLARNVRS